VFYAVFLEAFTIFHPSDILLCSFKMLNKLVGGFLHPSEKICYRQNGFIFPKFRGENKTYMNKKNTTLATITASIPGANEVGGSRHFDVSTKSRP